MSNFLIKQNRALKESIKSRTIKNNFVGKQNTLTAKTVSPNTFQIKVPIIDKTSVSPTISVDGISIRSKQNNNTIKINNYAKIIRIRKDTTPVRTNLYDYINSVFKEPVIVDKYEFCYEQKISTSFSTNGYVQWFSSYIDKQPSYKTSLFSRISYSPLSISDDCSCRIFNFNGIYTVDRRKPEDDSLVLSSNKNISKIKFDFDPIENYIIVSIYSFKTKSYVKIRLRPPLRYRPIYDDWVFDDSVIIDNIMSSTEYSEIIDCCQNFDQAEILKALYKNKNV